MDDLTRLALRARAGDEFALTSFVRSSQADVWRFLAHLVDRESADDLTQDVYLRAIPASARFRGDASAKVWLLSIARRTAADDIRRRVRNRRQIADVAVPDMAARGDEDVVDLADLIDHLKPDRRTAFVLTQVLGVSYEEAAGVCNVPIGTIRSRIARARADLIAFS